MRKIRSSRPVKATTGTIPVTTATLIRKVVGAGRLRGTLDGDWDLHTVMLAETAKHKSMVQRFVDRIEWEETEIFRDTLPRRLAGGLAFRGSFDLKEIAQFYRDEMDPLFQCLKDKGFRPFNPPKVLIGRDGEIMLGDQGNHRVAMAKILNIATIPCVVVCRHQLWSGS